MLLHKKKTNIISKNLTENQNQICEVNLFPVEPTTERRGRIPGKEGTPAAGVSQGASKGKGVRRVSEKIFASRPRPNANAC